MSSQTKRKRAIYKWKNTLSNIESHTKRIRVAEKEDWTFTLPNMDIQTETPGIELDCRLCKVCDTPTNLRCPYCKTVRVYYCCKEHQRGEGRKHKKVCGVIKPGNINDWEGPSFQVNNFVVKVNRSSLLISLYDLQGKQYIWEEVVPTENGFGIKYKSDDELRDILLQLAEIGDIDFLKQLELTERYLNVVNKVSRSRFDMGSVLWIK